jgi:hypothetical protein
MTTERTEAPEPEAPPQRPLPQWLNSTLEWGTRARVGKGGLTLGALNVGLYGEIPDRWDEMTRMPRGAFPVPGVPPIQRYPLNAKIDLWADNAADLYEEGISRRWIPAQDIPWEQATRLPDDVELALAQVCTELSQQAQVQMDTVSRWLQEMSYGYHEVKVYLATEVFDAGRLFEAFRKRALVNGGGLGLESPGQFNRFLLEVRAGWTETSVALHLLRGSFTHMLYRYLAAYAPTPADVVLFPFALQDSARHTAYSLQHLHYAISRNPQKALDLQTTLGGAESFAVQDERDPVLWEALAIVFGGGVRQIDEGMQVVRRLRRDYLERYLALLKWVGVDRRERLNKELARNLEPDAVAAA